MLIDEKEMRMLTFIIANEFMTARCQVDQEMFSQHQTPSLQFHLLLHRQNVCLSALVDVWQEEKKNIRLKYDVNHDRKTFPSRSRRMAFME